MNRMNIEHKIRQAVENKLKSGECPTEDNLFRASSLGLKLTDFDMSLSFRGSGDESKMDKILLWDVIFKKCVDRTKPLDQFEITFTLNIFISQEDLSKLIKWDPLTLTAYVK